jgi:hypothetical protein
MWYFLACKEHSRPLTTYLRTFSDNELEGVDVGLFYGLTSLQTL